MKSISKLRVAAPVSRGIRFLRNSAAGGVVLASLIAATSTYGQGQYYPVNPPGAPYGNTYRGLTVNSNSDLQFLQVILQNLYGANVTLQVPVPTGSSAPTTAQFSAAVQGCISSILTGVAPSGVTLSTLANEAVAWRPADRSATATALAQTIVQYNTGTAVANLTVVVDALSKSQPTLIDTILPGILNVAGSSSTVSVASSIPQLVAAATANISTDAGRVSSLVSAGLASLNTANLTAAQKTTAFVDPTSGFVGAILSTSNNDPTLIDAMVKGVTYGGFSGMASLTQVLNAAVAALPIKNATTLGALVNGALRSQGGSAVSIAATVAAANPATATYTNFVVGGYSNSSTLLAFQNYVTANPTAADAIASGAVIKGTLTPPVIVQWALRNGTAAPRDVVAATVEAYPSYVLATVTGAINTTTHTPWGAATFGDLAYGGASVAPAEQVGNVVQTILQNSSTGITALNSAVVNSVVDQALRGAQAGLKPGTYADVVYKAEVVGRNTAGVSAPLVRQAIDTLNAVGGSSASFIGAVAALAGDAYGANRAAIQTAAYGVGGELQLTGGDVVAATAGGNLVQLLQTQTAKTFTSTLSAFYTANSNASPTNSAIANVYAAILTNPTEADAGLAAAIKQSTVSDTMLTSVASDALRVSNTTFFGVNPNLQMVRDVVSHIKTLAIAGNNYDVVDFVSHQIVLNPTLTKDIAIAATVIDPDNAHFVAHAVAFNNPMSASASVASIFTYAQITNPTPLALPTAGNLSGALGTKAFPGSTLGAILDQPAAAAAITAGLTTGILEANRSVTDTQNALVATVSAAVAASLTQNGTNLRGMVNPFNAPGDTAKNFQQSDGGVGTVKSGTNQTIGAAGAITGYVAQVTNAGDTTISAITKAVLTAAVGGGARPYALEMAQAAAQALRWVGGVNVSTAAAGALVAGNPIFDIANAIAPSVVGFATLAQLQNAVAFGISQAAAGVIGAGALGLNATGLNPGTGVLTIKATGNNNSDFYQHRSAAGTPVTDIFNL